MSAHPSHSPLPGDNPNYYAEVPGDSSQSHPTQPNPTQQNGAPASSTQAPHFPPPPPGPPPATQQYNQYPPPPGPPPANLEQQYYPPPPPGPPPTQAHEPNYVPPPSYSEIETGPGLTVTDEKPPILPPRPVSSQGVQGGQGGQAVPQFPPPPTEASIAQAAANYQQQQQQQQQHPPAPGTEPAASPAAKPGFGRKLYEWGIKAGVPINKITNKLGSEAFWPTSMDKECDKAARILKSFCKDGFYANQSSSSTNPPPSPNRATPTPSGPSGKPKVLVKIPQSAIANAKGLAIFTTFRTGFHISGAGGSGLVVSRLPDGRWSPPAGFLVHTLGAGIMAGLDIYDCVCVLNTPAAVEAFTKPRLSLGGEIAVVAGPIGAGHSVEAALSKSIKPVWSYMKSRGLYGGVQVDGTVIIQRPDANAAFYGVDKITVDKILRGEVQHPNKISNTGKKDDIVMWPEGARQLNEVLKAAEGKGADEGVMKQLGDQPTPGDLAPAPDQQHLQQPATQHHNEDAKVRFS
ncbi:hypothetical protein M426DRAFT_322489 [Hypoxylon sp. CI-4A]|nr:hypothetical protein M426DRAFT_322489 [Hypoxylon sp. CI-4A]